MKDDAATQQALFDAAASASGESPVECNIIDCTANGHALCDSCKQYYCVPHSNHKKEHNKNLRKNLVASREAAELKKQNTKKRPLVPEYTVRKSSRRGSTEDLDTVRLLAIDFNNQLGEDFKTEIEGESKKQSSDYRTRLKTLLSWTTVYKVEDILQLYSDLDIVLPNSSNSSTASTPNRATLVEGFFDALLQKYTAINATEV